MRLRMALGASLLMSHFGCAPCPPGGGPCTLIYVASVATSQPVNDATVTITASPPVSPTPTFYSTTSCTGQQDGCYMPRHLGLGCTGSFRIRVEHPSFQPFEQMFTAPIGRQYECAEASYRIDVRLTPR